MDAEYKQKVQNMEDQMAIDRLEKIYGYYLDNSMNQEVVDLFSDNAESVEIMSRGVFKGKAGIKRFFLDYLGKKRDTLTRPGGMGFHTQHQGVITVAPDGKTAKGRWYLVMIMAMSIEDKENGPLRSVLGHGVYENEFVKEDGVWKFSKMFMSLHFLSPIAEGWTFIPAIGQGRVPQSDAPSTAFHPYPDIQKVPVHWKHPVTGK
jgi:hypothetical protein